MKKTLIYTVSLAILAVAAFNTYLMATGQADAHTLVETVAVYGIVIFLAAAYFVKTVGKPSFPSWRKPAPEPDTDGDAIADKLDEIADESENIKGDLDDIKDAIAEIQDAVGKFPAPDAWVPTVNTVDGNGKLEKVYDLPPADTVEEAITAAKESIQARDSELRPVPNPRITVTPVFYA